MRGIRRLIVGSAGTLALSASLIACGGQARTVRRSAAAGDAKRPLRVGVLAAGARCPISPQVATSPNFGRSIGSGPLYPVIPDRGVLQVVPVSQTDLRGVAPRGSYLEKVLWVAPPTFHGVVIIRGLGRDRPNHVWFTYNGPITSQLRLDSVAGGHNPSGWRGWPTTTFVAKPGCYSYQVDGSNFQQHLTFKAVRAP